MTSSPFAQQVTFLYARELEPADRFYREVLGLPLVLDQGTCRIYRAAGEAFLGVCGGREPNPAGLIVTLVSDDLAGWHERLVAAGVEVEAPPAYNPTYDIEHFFCRDPMGYRIEIQRFCAPEWPAPGA